MPTNKRDPDGRGGFKAEYLGRVVDEFCPDRPGRGLKAIDLNGEGKGGTELPRTGELEEQGSGALCP